LTTSNRLQCGQLLLLHAAAAAAVLPAELPETAAPTAVAPIVLPQVQLQPGRTRRHTLLKQQQQLVQ
jgi:hypothetical protein